MYRFGLRNLLVALVGALIALAGCAGDNGDERARPAPSTTASPGGCPDGGAVPPEGALEVSEADADVDGDGSTDRLFAYRRSDGDRRIAVELAGGGRAVVEASAGRSEGPVPLSVLGGVDLGGDGDTVVAVTGAGASVVIVGLFQFVECTLAPVTFASGRTVELPVGGAITHGDGLRCAGDGGGPPLVRLSATSTDGRTFTATETGYRVEGTTLVELGSQSTTLTRESDDEQINAYYSLDCPALDNGLGPL